MRRSPLLPFAAVLSMLVVAPHASGQVQAEDGCVEANPCILTVDVDDLGIASVSQLNFTSGDWFMLSVYNDDDVRHTVSLAGHAASVTVEAVDIQDSEKFPMGAPGTYALRDEPTSDTVTLNVVAGDVVDYEDGPSTSGKTGIPGAPLPLLTLGLLAAVALRRR